MIRAKSMPIFVCGINHKTASIDLREKVFFTTEKLSLYLQDFVAHPHVGEAVLLSTCNRSEIYCQASHADVVIQWFLEQNSTVKDLLKESIYIYRDQEAVEYIMQVACGLDSMILGESQILGQMKTAFSESCAAGTVGTLFNRLFQQIFAVAKEVRTNTAIGACPVSVSSAAVRFITQHYPNPLNEARILCIGAGLTIDLALRHLQHHSPRHIMITNRHEDTAQRLAEKYSGTSHAFTHLKPLLSDADIVLTATHSPIPLVTPSMMEPRTKPLWIVDIAVPRDVDPAVADCAFVHLYSVDDLKDMIHHSLHDRSHAALKAREMIKEKSREFMIWLQSIDLMAETIKTYRKKIEDDCHIELKKAIKLLERGDDPEKVLTQFAYALTNKFLHTPSVQLRHAGIRGRIDLLQLAQELFAVPTTESSPS